MFAHQGGWDEFLYVLAPIVVIVTLLRIATSRAKKLGGQKDSDSVNPRD
jgi:hypothetical protein